MGGPSTNGLRVGLVLGSGGIAGGAYHAGVLKALNDRWGIDARDVDVIVGTSAGAIAAALIGAGLHPNDLFRRETGTPLSPAGRTLLTPARARRGTRPVVQSNLAGPPAAPGVLLRALRQPKSVSLGSVVAAMLPRGGVTIGHVMGMIDGLLGDQWPTGPELRISAVELHTARRAVFGPLRHAADLEGRAVPVAATPAQAVGASCAVPSVFAPVDIDGNEYFDGGAHSADNLDLIGTGRFDLVVVSSPISADRPFTGELPLMGLRALSRIQTEHERRLIDPHSRVEIIRPTPADLDAMGSNLMDPQRRPAIACQAYSSATSFLSARPRPGLAPAASAGPSRNPKDPS